MSAMAGVSWKTLVLVGLGVAMAGALSCKQRPTPPRPPPVEYPRQRAPKAPVVLGNCTPHSCPAGFVCYFDQAQSRGATVPDPQYGDLRCHQQCSDGGACPTDAPHCVALDTLWHGDTGERGRPACFSEPCIAHGEAQVPGRPCCGRRSGPYCVAPYRLPSAVPTVGCAGPGEAYLLPKGETKFAKAIDCCEGLVRSNEGKAIDFGECVFPPG
ncbi:MAG: hypothetical protein K1X89_01560 [Myxococcaceae bacterium]|nr:hypothetical protein [Myxococcaceae bacterium]